MVDKSIFRKVIIRVIHISEYGEKTQGKFLILSYVDQSKGNWKFDTFNDAGSFISSLMIRKIAISLHRTMIYQIKINLSSVLKNN